MLDKRILECGANFIICRRMYRKLNRNEKNYYTAKQYLKASNEYYLLFVELKKSLNELHNEMDLILSGDFLKEKGVASV